MFSYEYNTKIDTVCSIIFIQESFFDCCQLVSCDNDYAIDIVIQQLKILKFTNLFLRSYPITVVQIAEHMLHYSNKTNGFRKTYMGGLKSE